MPRDARPPLLPLAIGAAAVAAGVALTLRPFSSLDALVLYIAASLVLAGVGELVGARDRSDRVTGALLATTGLVAALAPGLTVRATATVVGIGMVLTGVARTAAGLRGDAGERYTATVGGVAGVVLGVLALVWPDVTILVIALLVGPLAVVLGAGQILRALRSDEHARRRHPWLRATGATAALVLAGLLALLSAKLHEGTTTTGPFYAYDDELPAGPGALLRDGALTRGIPAGAVARRILYTTRRPDGSIGLASGIVLSRPGGAAHPVLLWDHGTTGVAQRCAPSALPDPFAAGAMPALDAALRRGWAVVAPDYPGLGAGGQPHPYLVGVPAARSGLDAVRAARRLPGLTLGPRTVVWGHSQGGGAALWTGIEAQRYAPDVPLAGVAALAPASDVLSLARNLQTSPVGKLFATFVVQGYSDAYADVRFGDYVRPAARTIVRRIAGRCLTDPATLLSLPPVLSRETIFARDLTSGPLGRRLAQNVPTTVTRTPTLIAQGLTDDLVLPAVQRRFARRLCAAGQPLDVRTYAGRDHVGVVADDSPLIPQLLRWTDARFAGRPFRRACG